MNSISQVRSVGFVVDLKPTVFFSVVVVVAVLFCFFSSVLKADPARLPALSSKNPP